MTKLSIGIALGFGLALALSGCVEKVSDSCGSLRSCGGGGTSGGGASTGGAGGSSASTSGGTGGGGIANSGGGGAGGTPPCGGACTAPKAVCDRGTDTCVECLEKTDCSGTKGLCDTGLHTCVECLANKDCTDPTKSRCDAGVCAPCGGNGDCSHLTGTTVCDAAAAAPACVQCTGTDYSACGTDSATSTPLVCDSLEHTCTANKLHSSGPCGSCVTDAQCPLGQVCLLDKYGTTPQEVGYFCHWKVGDTANGAPTDCFGDGQPYARTMANAVSIDGITADVCTLRVSTCIANNQFSAKNCAPTGTPDDSQCGFSPPTDAKCGQVSGSNYRCTMTCLSTEDCPLGSTCNTLVNPHLCSLQ